MLRKRLRHGGLRTEAQFLRWCDPCQGLHLRKLVGRLKMIRVPVAQDNRRIILNTEICHGGRPGLRISRHSSPHIDIGQYRTATVNQGGCAALPDIKNNNTVCRFGRQSIFKHLPPGPKPSKAGGGAQTGTKIWLHSPRGNPCRLTLAFNAFKNLCHSNRIRFKSQLKPVVPDISVVKPSGRCIVPSTITIDLDGINRSFENETSINLGDEKFGIQRQGRIDRIGIYSIKNFVTFRFEINGSRVHPARHLKGKRFTKVSIYQHNKRFFEENLLKVTPIYFDHQIFRFVSTAQLTQSAH